MLGIRTSARHLNILQALYGNLTI